MKVISVNINPDQNFIVNRLEYTLEFINNHPHTPKTVRFELNSNGFSNIIYDRKSRKEGPKTIVQSGCLFKEKTIDLKNINFKNTQYNDYTLYFLHNGDVPVKWYNEDAIHFDLFESIFFFIARVEEVFCNPKVLDDLNRFPSNHSLAVRQNFEKLPIADVLILTLLEWLNINPEISQNITYVTHDLDEILKFNGLGSLFRSWLGTLKRKESLKNLLILTQKYFGKFDPYDTFDYMLLQGEEFEKYLFVPGNFNHPSDPEIWTRKDHVKRAIRKAISANYKIGIHAGISSSNDLENLKRDIKFLQSEYDLFNIYNRFHYLVFDWSTTPFFLEHVNVSEDHSLGWNDITGYRCGTGVKYRLYNFEEERAFRFYTVPLICMDVALQRESEYNLGGAFSILNELDKNKKSFISYNFHNSIFFQSQLKGYPMDEIYTKIFKLKN